MACLANKSRPFVHQDGGRPIHSVMLDARWRLPTVQPGYPAMADQA